jgi:hypothetical protein
VRVACVSRLDGDAAGYGQVLQLPASEVQPRTPRLQVGLQVRLRQSAMLLQLTSHAHDEPQLTSLHDALPVQAMLHGPRPQLSPLQLWLPLQVILHDVAPRQLTPLLHAPSREHSTWQLRPVGQITCCLQPPFSAQSIVQLF